MKHYGDITKINGALVEPVNVIIGGSPCQDLSVAGKRAGLAGERSGLFMEQLRIIKEMRRADLEQGRTGKDTRPRYMVWENVPGAFSSNKGADFCIVLQETAKVACEQAPAVPIPKNGWPPAGCLTDVGGQWSIAWRVFDAQFWGVPQRRKRIALVADFGGLTAPEILFERQGVPGYIKPCGKEGQATPGNIETCFNTAGSTRGAYCIQGNCIDRADTAGCNGKGWTEGVSYTLNTIDRHAVLPFEPKAFGICSYSSNSMKSSNPHSGIYEADTSKTLDLNCGNPGCNQGGIAVVTPFCAGPLTDGEGLTQTVNDTLLASKKRGHLTPCTLKIRSGCEGGGKGALIQENKSATLSTSQDQIPFQPMDVECRNGALSETFDSKRAQSGDNQPAIALENHPADSRVKIAEDGIVQTLNARMGTGGECSPRYVLYQKAIGSLCARDSRGIGNQYVQEGKLFIMEVRNDNV